MKSLPFTVFDEDDTQHIELIDSLTKLCYQQGEPGPWSESRTRWPHKYLLGYVKPDDIEASIKRIGLDPSTAGLNYYGRFLSKIVNDFHNSDFYSNLGSLDALFEIQRHSTIDQWWSSTRFLSFYNAYKVLVSPPPMLEYLHGFFEPMYQQRPKPTSWNYIHEYSPL